MKTSTEYVQEWRDKNPDRNQELRLRERVAKKRAYQKRRILIDSLKDVPCADCGGKFPPECMDFHHVHGEKDFGIATSYDVAEVRLRAEIASVSCCVPTAIVSGHGQTN
jgi:hypothetical protein